MPHRKPIVIFDVGVADLQVLDLRSRRPAFQKLKQVADAILGTFDMSFD